MKWIVTEQPKGNLDLRTFLVRQSNWEEWKAIEVWFDSRARCCACSGPLTAMLSTCAHSKAVARHIKNSAKDQA